MTANFFYFLKQNKSRRVEGGGILYQVIEELGLAGSRGFSSVFILSSALPNERKLSAKVVSGM